jgi:hypothetical protein
MPYFHISTGLRGCCASFVFEARSRRELRACLADEARYLRDAGYVGANERAVSALATAAWRDRQNTRERGEHFLAFGHAHMRAPMRGLFVSNAAPADYDAYLSGLRHA